MILHFIIHACICVCTSTGCLHYEKGMRSYFRVISQCMHVRLYTTSSLHQYRAWDGTNIVSVSSLYCMHVRQYTTSGLRMVKGMRERAMRGWEHKRGKREEERGPEVSLWPASTRLLLQRVDDVSPPAPATESWTPLGHPIAFDFQRCCSICALCASGPRHN